MHGYGASRRVDVGGAQFARTFKIAAQRRIPIGPEDDAGIVFERAASLAGLEFAQPPGGTQIDGQMGCPCGQ
jgi:hypothetical protein